MKNDTKKIKLNAIDVIAVFLIIAALTATAVFFFMGKGIFTSNTEEVEYVISIDYLPTDFINNISAGTEIFDSETSFSLGVVSNIELSVITEDYSSMKLFVTASAHEEHGVLYVNSLALKNGTPIAFRTPDLMYDGVCTTVVRKGSSAK